MEKSYFMIIHQEVLIMIFGLILLLLYYLVKIYFKISNRNDILEELCVSINENRLVECIKILEQYPHLVNKFNKTGYTPFHLACATGNTQFVKLMLKIGADVKLKSLQQETSFYLTCFYYIKNPKLKNATCIRELYYAGADINEPNSKGLTPLQMAALFGHTSLVKWLLHKNASDNVIPHPLLLAMTQGHHQIKDMFLQQGCGFAIEFK